MVSQPSVSVLWSGVVLVLKRNVQAINVEKFEVTCDDDDDDDGC